jgi:hypothetical protein
MLKKQCDECYDCNIKVQLVYEEPYGARYFNKLYYCRYHMRRYGSIDSVTLIISEPETVGFTMQNFYKYTFTNEFYNI